MVHLKGFLPIIVPKPTRLKQPINYTPFVDIGLIEQVPNEPIFVLLVQIVIPHDTFK